MRYNSHGLRLAFDRIEEDGIFQSAIERLKGAGVAKNNLMAYVLFNFDDTPQQAHYRFRECARMGIRPYPQQFQPLNRMSRDQKFIGRYWTANLLRHFRQYWLMAGYFNKLTFEQYVAGLGDKARMTDKDWAAWHAETKGSPGIQTIHPCAA